MTTSRRAILQKNNGCSWISPFLTNCASLAAPKLQSGATGVGPSAPNPWSVVFCALPLFVRFEFSTICHFLTKFLVLGLLFLWLAEKYAFLPRCVLLVHFLLFCVVALTAHNRNVKSTRRNQHIKSLLGRYSPQQVSNGGTLQARTGPDP